MPVIHFTARALAALKPPKNKVHEEYWDSTTPGLGLRISRQGRRVWTVRYRIRDTREMDRQTLGLFEAMPLVDARIAAEEYLLAASKGQNLKRERLAAIEEEAKVRQARERTFSWLVDQYVASKSVQGGVYLREEERILRRECIRFWDSPPDEGWGKRLIAEITRHDVEDLLRKTLERTSKPSPNPRRGTGVHANRVYAVVKRVFNFALDRDYLENSPCARVKRPLGDENSRDRVLSLNELAILWRELVAESKSGRMAKIMASILKLQILTAQRGGEVRSIAWSEVDLDRGVWEIPGAKTKNGVAQSVPLSNQATEIFRELLEMRETSAWVFPGRRAGKHVVNIQEAVQRFRRRTGIEHVAHDFRRSCATHLAMMGVSNDIVKLILNHVDGKDVTAIYNRHKYFSEKEAALQAWADHLMTAVNKPDEVKVVPLARATVNAEAVGNVG